MRGNKFLYCGLFLLLISSGFVFCGEIKNAVKTINKCYSEFLSLYCPYMESIELLDVKYGAVPVTEQCPEANLEQLNNSLCCQHAEPSCYFVPDYVDLHRIYADFSLKSQEQWKTNWKTLGKDSLCSANRTTTNFIQLKYKCLPDSSVVGMSTSTTSISGPELSLLFQGVSYQDSSLPGENITCNVTASGSSYIEIYSIDVRLQEYPDSNGSCHFEHSLWIWNEDEEHVIRCEDKNITTYGRINITTAGHWATVRLIIQPGGVPQAVWLGIKATTTGEDITATCHGKTAMMGPRETTTIKSLEQGQPVHLETIIGISIGVVFGLAFILGAIFFKIHRNKKQRKKDREFKEFAKKFRKTIQPVDTLQRKNDKTEIVVHDKKTDDTFDTIDLRDHDDSISGCENTGCEKQDERPNRSSGQRMYVKNKSKKALKKQ